MLKHYQQIDQTNPDTSFSIKRMEALFDATQGTPDHPHRHSYYTLIWIIQGNGKHLIDFQDYTLGNGQLYCISPGQVHQLNPSERPIGWVLTFSSEFLIQNSIRQDFIADLQLFRSEGETPALKPDPATATRLTGYFEEMATLVEQPVDFQYEALGAYLKLLLIFANHACTLPADTHAQSRHASLTILRNFKSLVEAQFRSAHQVQAYAEQLAVTADHLNKTVKTLLGQTAKAYIQDRIILEAKRLLSFSEMNGKELAYYLGFEEPTHFRTFFKNCTGQTISQFRKQHGFL